MRGVALSLFVVLAGCRSIREVEAEAFRARVERLGDGITAARRAAEREPSPAFLAERRRVLDGLERDREAARRVGEAALRFDDPRGFEHARELLDDVERRLSVLPR